MTVPISFSAAFLAQHPTAKFYLLISMPECERCRPKGRRDVANKECTAICVARHCRVPAGESALDMALDIPHLLRPAAVIHAESLGAACAWDVLETRLRDG